MHGLEKKNLGLGLACPSSAVQTWARCLTSLSLSFLICKMG